MRRALAIASRLPLGLRFRLRKWFVEYGVPANRHLGIKVVEVGPGTGSVVLKLPYRRSNLNVAGTVHGAAILALAESVHGVAILWRFDPADHLMYTRRANLEFLSPGRTALTVRYVLSPQTIETIENRLRQAGRHEFDLECTVRDQEGEPIAHLSATYHLRRLSADR